MVISLVTQGTHHHPNGSSAPDANSCRLAIRRVVNTVQVHASILNTLQ
jgi:hypothetical protein